VRVWAQHRHGCVRLLQGFACRASCAALAKLQEACWNGPQSLARLNGPACSGRVWRGAARRRVGVRVMRRGQQGGVGAAREMGRLTSTRQGPAPPHASTDARALCATSAPLCAAGPQGMWRARPHTMCECAVEVGRAHTCATAAHLRQSRILPSCCTQQPTTIFGLK
jgi:hypothetical protein